MPPRDVQPTRFSPGRRWLVWLLYAVAWTTMLVIPISGSGPWKVAQLDIDLRAVVAKSLHVSAYALFAILSGWLFVPLRFRWLLMGFLMAHGTIMELIQLHVPGRTGSLHD